MYLARTWKRPHTVTSVQIDKETNRYSPPVVDLHARKSSLSPIFRLPDELLEVIFLYGARRFHEGNSRLTLRIPHWVNVSYVCRHWRDVALNFPTLWSYHFTLSHRWTEELLARSKQASLRIRIYSDDERTNGWWSRLLKKLLNHADRIQELRLCIPATVLPKLSLRVPRLQVLYIQVHSEWSDASEWSFTIDSQDISPLRMVKLTDCPLPWRTLNLNGLTTLFLCRFPPPKENIVELLAVLRRMPCLTVLHLDRALASAQGFLPLSIFDFPSKIDLSCLARLFVSAPLSAVAALLSHITIPLKTEVRLVFRQEDDSSAEDYARIPSALAQRFNQPNDLASSGSAICSLGLHCLVSHPTFTLSASGYDDCDPYMSVEYPEWECNIPFAIRVQMEQPVIGGDCVQITSDICRSIPSMGVKSLHVANPPLSLNFWRKMLSHLPELQRLAFSGGRMPNLVSLLAPTPDELPETRREHITSNDHDPTSGHILVPELQDLMLYGVAFAAEDGLSNDTVSEKSLRDALAALDVRRPRLTTVECYVENGSYMDDDDSEDSYYSDEDN